MHHFFVKPEQAADGKVRITGPDVNHLKNVLRMKPGEQLLVSDGQGKDYLCRVETLEAETVEVQIMSQEESRELPSRIWLFQGLPKSDKMELIIQKAVELGAAGIVPVATKNAVVKLEPKKEEAKLKRWRTIAESAAKQSKRSLVPEISGVMTLREAFSYIEAMDFDLRLIPYENERGTEAAREAFGKAVPGSQIAVFIGPEGGFEPSEIQLALDAGVIPVSLGKRILRTETAGIAVLSALMLRLEGCL